MLHHAVGLAACLAALIVAIVPSGCAVDRKYSQTELAALESRDFDAPFDRTFDQTIGALFDLGYTIVSSDKRAGFIQGAGVQVKVDSAGPSRTTVRVSTSAAGQVRVDKQRIDEVLNRIEQRLTTAAPAASPRRP